MIFIKDSHAPDSVEFKTFPRHCIKGTTEAELIDELRKYEKEGISIDKNSTSAILLKFFCHLLIVCQV